MLCEKIFFERDIPVEVTAVMLEKYPMHYHTEIELLYVLDGEIEMKCSGRTHKMSKGKVAVINSLELHEITGLSEECAIMMVHLDPEYFEGYYPGFEENYYQAPTYDRAATDSLRAYASGLMMALISKSDCYEDEVIEYAHNIISCLKIKDVGEEKTGDPAARLRRVMRYVCDNYTRKLTLQEIADREDLNLYYLSHNIKDASGHTFQQLLNYIRVEASESLLLGTNMTIGQIAEATGFSAVRYYTKHFEEWLGMHPSEYRQKHEGQDIVHTTGFQGRRCTAVKIEELLGDEDGKKSESDGPELQITIDIDLEEALEQMESGVHQEHRSSLRKIMEKQLSDAFGEPYRKFMGLDEEVLAEGDNYIITCPAGTGGSRLSVFLMGMDEAMTRSLLDVETDEDLLRLTEDYNKTTEYVFRFSGCKGELQALRYRLNKLGIVRRMSASVGRKGMLDSRQRLMQDLEAEPTVYKAHYKSAGTFRIRTVFDGLGIEMILIDKK